MWIPGEAWGAHKDIAQGWETALARRKGKFSLLKASVSVDLGARQSTRPQSQRGARGLAPERARSELVPQSQVPHSGPRIGGLVARKGLVAKEAEDPTGQQHYSNTCESKRAPVSGLG